MNAKVGDGVTYVDGDYVEHAAAITEIHEDGTADLMMMENFAWTVINVPHKSSVADDAYGVAFWYGESGAPIATNSGVVEEVKPKRGSRKGKGK